MSPLKLFATTRSGQDLGLQSSHATRSVLYPKLDITDRNSVKSFAKEVTQYGSVDVLINNAGINLDNDYSAANAQKTMDVNYTAMLDVSSPDSRTHVFGLTNEFSDVPNFHPITIKARPHRQPFLNRLSAQILQPRASSSFPRPPRHRRDSGRHRQRLRAIRGRRK